jgi:hypothetical protein
MQIRHFDASLQRASECPGVRSTRNDVHIGPTLRSRSHNIKSWIILLNYANYSYSIFSCDRSATRIISSILINTYQYLAMYNTFKFHSAASLENTLFAKTKEDMYSKVL